MEMRGMGVRLRGMTVDRVDDERANLARWVGARKRVRAREGPGE
jgi:hypothetical protein